MKPIILDANEMTDSTEVYSSRPNPFFVIFIYLVLAIIVIAMGWMCFSKIDIVVKAQGNVTTEDNSSTVTNTVAGNIKAINVVDGQQVNEGEVLYSLEYDEPDRQLKELEDSQTEINDRIVILNAYLEWLNGNNDALDGLSENQYYSEFLAKKGLVELNYDSVTESADNKKSQYSTSLNNAEDSISYYENEISKIELLLSAIKNRDNTFSEDEVYYYSLVESYISGYTSTSKQYDDKMDKLDESKSELEVQKSEQNDQITELKNLINQSKEKIETATLKINELEQVTETKVVEGTAAEGTAAEGTTTEGTAAEGTTTEGTTTEGTAAEGTTTEGTAAEGTTTGGTTTGGTTTGGTTIEGTSTQVTSTASNQQAIDEQKQIIVAENINIESYNTKITELTNSISELSTSIKTTESQITTYKQEKENALYNLQMENISTAEQKKKTTEETLSTLKGNKAETKTNLNNVSKDTDISMTKSSEISNTYTEILTYEAKKEEVQANIQTIENNINETTLIAAKSGAVNLLVDIEKGDYLSSGTEVMTIIPENSSEYVVDLYISNEDIGMLEEGMDVKYEIAAFPSSEYGNITGKIQTISKDTKVNDNSGISYYKATATVDSDTFYHATEEVGTLKVGMACETKVVTGQKSVMKYLLEKINLLD